MLFEVRCGGTRVEFRHVLAVEWFVGASMRSALYTENQGRESKHGLRACFV